MVLLGCGGARCVCGGGVILLIVPTYPVSVVSLSLLPSFLWL